MKTLLLVLLVGAAACSQDAEKSASQPASPTVMAAPPSTATAAPSTTSSAAAFTRVADVSQVCMVNDQYMGKPQIPVEVEGRTYDGCCPMCKDRLNNDPASRMARDPVTGESVDKAKAVIVQDARGKVLYFASEETFGRYRG